MQVIWFKRDLRLSDHLALQKAMSKGPVLLLYILEPELWQQPGMSHRQYMFLGECLRDLADACRSRGGNLVIQVGGACEILQNIHRDYGPITELWSHQETWNHWTYQRDREVAAWAKSVSVSWHQPPQNGVIRALKDRDGWAARWYQTMKKAPLECPDVIHSCHIKSDPWPHPENIGLSDDDCVYRQPGGSSHAWQLLDSFLRDRGQGYTREMSSPVTGYHSCSRLSAHIAFGTISIREVFHAAQKRGHELSRMPEDARDRWPQAIRSFTSRLRWHCHFIQKLEDEVSIEWQALHPAYREIRQEFDEKRFQAWQQGRTGYPLIDACMRALRAHGWINFRMRAMLMSFASYHLWLPWQRPAHYLASLFTDYEPGIHYSQVQMQSGTTGMNSLRVYNPIKQGVDQDPCGKFIRQWVPELAEMDQQTIHMPWLAPSQMNGYPMPIVDEKTARQFAASQLYGLRRSQSHKKVAQAIVKKHASRKVPRAGRKDIQIPKQGELPL